MNMSPSKANLRCNDRHPAVHLNNRASRLILVGKFEMAINLLTKALKCAKSTMDIANVDQLVSEYTLDSCMVSSPANTDKSETSWEENDQQAGYIYRTPIYAPATMSGSNYEETTILSVLIMFNLALAHHLSALEHEEFPLSRMRKAVKLYEYAYNMQRDERLVNNTLFTMCTLNNLGQIYQSVKASDIAEKCFEQLLSTLMFLVDCGEGRTTISGLEGFFHNTSHLVLRLGSAAAA